MVHIDGFDEDILINQKNKPPYYLANNLQKKTTQIFYVCVFFILIFHTIEIVNYKIVQ